MIPGTFLMQHNACCMISKEKAGVGLSLVTDGQAGCGASGHPRTLLIIQPVMRVFVTNVQFYVLNFHVFFKWNPNFKCLENHRTFLHRVISCSSFANNSLSALKDLFKFQRNNFSNFSLNIIEIGSHHFFLPKSFRIHSDTVMSHVVN